MSNADDDMCACGSGACDFYARLNRAQNANAAWRKITAQPLRYGPHGPIEPAPQPEPSGDEAKVREWEQQAEAFAKYHAERAAYGGASHERSQAVSNADDRCAYVYPSGPHKGPCEAPKENHNARWSHAFVEAPQPEPDPRCQFVWEGNAAFPGVCGVLKGLHHMQTHPHEFTAHSAYRTEAHCGASVVANSSAGLNVSLAAHGKRCGKCKGRYAPQPEPSGDEAKVREIANAALVSQGYDNSCGRHDGIVDGIMIALKEAYAAGKADGARAEQVRRHAKETGHDVRCERITHPNSLRPCNCEAIARRGSEGK